MLETADLGEILIQIRPGTQVTKVSSCDYDCHLQTKRGSVLQEEKKATPPLRLLTH